MTATLRNYTNMQLHGRLNFATELTDFPSDPSANDMVVINGVLWFYSMVGGLLTWLPLSNQKNTYTHTQGLEAQTWTVNHNLGSEDFVLGVYNTDNNLMSPASLTDVTENSFKLNFTEAVKGRAVAIFNTALFAPEVTTEQITASTVNIAGGVVVADETGLQVNGAPVQTLNSQGQADYGTL